MLVVAMRAATTGSLISVSTLPQQWPLRVERQLDELGIWIRLDQLARRLVDAADSTYVATVVPGDLALACAVLSRAVRPLLSSASTLSGKTNSPAAIFSAITSL